MADKQTVAVVGSGMAGLVTAFLLQQDKKSRYDVQLFETVRITTVVKMPVLTYCSKITSLWTPLPTPSQEIMATTRRLIALTYPCAHSTITFTIT
jgi:NADH dehydrogenase FAD-containing subunit